MRLRNIVSFHGFYFSAGTKSRSFLQEFQWHFNSPDEVRMKAIAIGGKWIGEGNPCFIIAEGGLNHNGDPEMAERLIETAADCGADAVKFQTYTTEELFSPDHPDYAKFKKMVFDKKTYQKLRTTAQNRGLVFLSTPFDEASADLLEAAGVPAFKIGSGEVTHLAFLRFLAEKGKPLILSTGMSSLSEVDAAVQTLRKTGNEDLILLHCVSAYPCPVEQANVRTITLLRERYQAPVGFSDHTTTDAAAPAAVALGACVVEKHFTLSRHLPGWDHFFSYDPGQMRRLIATIRETESALGRSDKRLLETEQPIRAIARRAIYARLDLKAGETLTRDNLMVRRPEGPLHADQLDAVLGKKTSRARVAGEALRPEDVE